MADLLDDAHRYPSAEALADALAQRVGQVLTQGVRERGRASLVVSGGPTPVPFFEALSGHELPWQSVSVTLADERWVPVNSADSNERLVREHLLRGSAARARFVGLYTAASAPAAGEAVCAQALAAIPRPFDAVILGMGGDGHTASLFPGSPELDEALSASPERPCVGVVGDEAPRERITLTPATLLASRWIALHIDGEQKWRVLEAAVAPGSVSQYPVRAVLHQRRTPVHVYWSP